jgi:hypothetical protein
MKTSFLSGLALVSAFILFSCDSPDDPQATELTGRQVSYNLVPGNAQFNVSGTIDFKERTDKSILIEIEVNCTGSGGEHPVLLHFGTLGTPDADIAALFTPVSSVT